MLAKRSSHRAPAAILIVSDGLEIAHPTPMHRASGLFLALTIESHWVEVPAVDKDEADSCSSSLISP
jgi:hypothetical protein